MDSPTHCSTYAVADLGFSRGGGVGHQSLSLAQEPFIWQVFCRKLHENERNWTEGGCTSLWPPLDPLMLSVSIVTQSCHQQ